MIRDRIFRDLFGIDFGTVTRYVMQTLSGMDSFGVTYRLEVDGETVFDHKVDAAGGGFYVGKISSLRKIPAFRGKAVQAKFDNLGMEESDVIAVPKHQILRTAIYRKAIEEGPATLTVTDYDGDVTHIHFDLKIAPNYFNFTRSSAGNNLRCHHQFL